MPEYPAAVQVALQLPQAMQVAAVGSILHSLSYSLKSCLSSSIAELGLSPKPKSITCGI
jgi:hypothetical protein